MEKLTKALPEKYQPYLQSKSIKKYDIKKDKVEIINKILALGDLEDIDWLKFSYGKDEVVSTFINDPYNIYTKPVYLYLKNYLLDLENTYLDEKKYVKNTYRNT